jgi:hypothetical protein
LTIFPIVDRDEAAQTIRESRRTQAAALDLLIAATVEDGVVRPKNALLRRGRREELNIAAAD